MSGAEPTDDDAAFIEAMARRLTNLKTLSGLSSLRMVKTLPDGGYVIAQDMGGVFRCITHKPDSVEPERPAFDGVAQGYVPMLFSGVIENAVVKPGRGVELRITEQTRRRVAGYLGDEGIESIELRNIPDRVELQRFVIDYNTQVSEFKPKIDTPLTFTQYAQQRPTWYSGAMAEVMQIVGGYGRQDFDNLPSGPFEQARFPIPANVMEQISIEIGNVRLPGYTGIPNEKGQFQYDYKFSNTHAVAFDDQNKPWLIQVSANGVYAMPFPLVPATTTKAFKQYIEDIGDTEIQKILERFGGMPSGETFPSSTEDFEAWRRAGVIIRICDTADFYDHIAYSTACGWTFNSTGRQAYNTCYDYYDDEGLGYGLAYKLSLTLGHSDNDGKLPQSFHVDGDTQRNKLNSYLSGLYQLMGTQNSAKHLAIKYKIRRVDVEQILERATYDPDERELEYWDALELDPIATHSGSVIEFGRGYLYHGAKFLYQPQIKFPEPFMGGCVSHNFLPLANGLGKSSYPRCDTIMFCYFAGDDLKVVKYFRDDREYDRETEDNFDECMTVGSWEKTEYLTSTSLLGHFYTSDIDERQAIDPNTTYTRITGRDLGYDSKPYFKFDAPFWKPGTLWRNRYFARETEETTTEGHAMSVAICIPYLNRNAAIHAKEESVTGVQRSESGKRIAVKDPTTYRFWTYDKLMHWAGGLEVQNGRPYPVDANPVWVEIENYNPYTCSDFADQGSWIPGLPADYAWLIHPEAGVYMMNGGGGAPPYKAYYRSEQEEGSESGRLDYSVYSYPRLVHKDVPDSWYFYGSPDEYGMVFYRDGCRVTFGDSDYANLSEDVDGKRKFWGNTQLVDHQSAYHFIGVINE